MMRAWTIVALFASALTAAVPRQGPAAAVMVVHAWVDSDRGQVLSGLTKEDYTLVVDGVEVPLADISPRTEPVSVAVLYDVSRSVFWGDQPIEHELAHFVTALGTSGQVMFGTIGGRNPFTPFRPGTADPRGEIRRLIEVDDDEGYGNSPIWDVAYQAVTVLAGRPAPRAIVLITDGRATGNHYGLTDLADYAAGHGVAVHVIAKHSARRIYQGGGSAVLVQPAVPLQAVARITGGAMFTYPERQPDVAMAMFTSLAAGLRGLHAFRFTPPSLDGALHRLEIRARKTGVRVHAPAGFRAPRG